MTYRTDEEQNWFYVTEGRRQGPLDRRGLIQALLAHDVPEKTLVWRSGLHAWTKAGDLQELRLELPPPLPKEAGPADTTPRPDPPLPTEDGTMAAIGASPEGEADDTDEDDEEDELESAALDASGAPSEDRRRRRRRHKRKHSEKTSHKPRVLELLALFVVLALVLWFLLRRMNRVPEGTIIYQGRLRPVPEAVAPPPSIAAFGTIPEPLTHRGQPTLLRSHDSSPAAISRGTARNRGTSPPTR